MQEPVLVILAAGLGSRYGGLKQIDVVGNNGESIIDFSIYDAYQAGFRKVVLIIRAEHEALFDEHITNKIRPFMEVEYAYQDVHDLPAPFECPKERTKPWGTTQALLVTEPHINGPFMIINADDFYGRESFEIMYNFLKNEVSDDCFGMVGYQLTKTLTDNGTVTRGVCENENGFLSKIVEVQKIIRKNDKAYSVDENGNEVEIEDGICSMNFWGFTPAVYPLMKEVFRQFLEEKINVPKSEHVIPSAIGQLINEGKVKVKVMATHADWFGVTYPQDKDTVTRRIAQYKMQGLYPFDLWKD